jgi:hypothetical protein
MLKSRIEKIEKGIPINDDPYRDLTDVQLIALGRKFQLYFYNKMKDKNIAREYKELFIEKPDILELLYPGTATSKEAIPLLEKQRDWEMKYEKSQELREEIFEYYEKAIKAYKFFRHV